MVQPTQSPMMLSRRMFQDYLEAEAKASQPLYTRSARLNRLLNQIYRIRWIRKFSRLIQRIRHLDKLSEQRIALYAALTREMSYAQDVIDAQLHSNINLTEALPIAGDNPILFHQHDKVMTVVTKQNGIWEAEETNFFRHYLKQGDTFIDIGANIGYFSVIASQLVGESGHIYAVEPDPDNIAVLRANLQQTTTSANVTVLPIALSDRDGLTTLYLNRMNYGDHRLFYTDKMRSSEPAVREKITVATARGDRLFLHLPRIDCIKMDVQGHEWHVVNGMLRTLKRHKPLLLFEYWHDVLLDAGSDPGQLLDLLSTIYPHIYRLDANAKVAPITDKDLAFVQGNGVFYNLVCSAKPL